MALVKKGTRTYPHLTGIKDMDTQNTIRLLWDKAYSLDDLVTAKTAEITAANTANAELQKQVAQLSQQFTSIAPSKGVDQSSATADYALSGGSPSGGPPPSSNTPAPNHYDIVAQVHAGLNITSASTDAEIFKFAQTVVWNISQLDNPPTDPLAGLLMQAAGDGIYNCGGQNYAFFRFCYNNGANIKILTGSYTPQWTQEADVDLADWHAPIDPATPC